MAVGREACAKAMARAECWVDRQVLSGPVLVAAQDASFLFVLPPPRQANLRIPSCHCPRKTALSHAHRFPFGCKEMGGGFEPAK